MTALAVRLLGTLEVTNGGQTVDIPGLKPKVLLAVLALDVGQVVSTDRLAEAIWGSKPPRSARNALQVYVTTLRRALQSLPGTHASENVVRNLRRGYVLALPADQVDAQEFKRLARSAREHLSLGDTQRAVVAFGEALRLWRGSPFADLDDNPLLMDARIELEAAHGQIVRDAVRARLELGDDSIVPELELLVRQNSTDERLVSDLMLALYRDGQQARALGLFAQTRSALVEELGVDPGPELLTLHQRILQQDPALEPGMQESTSASLYVSFDARANPVPHPLTSFVGHRQYVGKAVSLLRADRCRLLTLVGPGGVGKTRVAIEVASALEDAFPSGVHFVSLAPFTRSADAFSELHRRLGAREDSNQDLVFGLKERLRGRRLLLVLDNFEQLAESAPLLTDLLADCRDLVVLVTSRVVLNVSGETVLRVRPLRLGQLPHELSEEDGNNPLSEAVALFLQRASSASGYKPDHKEAQHVAELCECLDGLPLALELAAAQTSFLSPKAMLEQVQHSLALLTAGPRDQPARQRSLAAAFDWSWELLDRRDSQLLSRLAYFPGGWLLSTAVQVSSEPEAEVIDRLHRLVDANLVDAREDGRFFILRVLREHAQARGETPSSSAANRRRFLEWAVERARQIDTQWEQGAEVASTLAEFEAESPNLLYALDLAAHAESSRELVALVGSLGRWLYIAGRGAQATRWLRAAVAQETPDLERANLLRILGGSAFTIDANPVQAELFQRQALRIYINQQASERILATEFNIAQTLRWQGRRREAVEAYKALLAKLEALEPPGQLAVDTLEALAEALDDCGETGAAFELGRRRLKLALMSGDKYDLAYSNSLMALLSIETRPLDCPHLIEDALAACRDEEVGAATRADVLFALGVTELALQHYGRARNLLLEALALMLESGYSLLTADALSALGVAVLLGEAGERLRAVSLLGAAEAMRQRNSVATVYRQLREALSSTMQLLHRSWQDQEERAWSRGELLGWSRASLRDLLPARSG